MEYCKNLEKCPFFNDEMGDCPKSAEELKKQYCKKSYHECARDIISSSIGKDHILKNLYPYERSRAKLIIKNHKR